MKIDLINDILSDLWNYDLALIGILLSIFVLLYSFITAKRDELREISSEIKREGISNNPSLKQREHNAKTYINNMQKLNKHCIWLLLFSTIHFFSSWCVWRCVSDTTLYSVKLISLFCLCAASFIITLLLILQIIVVYKQYKKYTKI